MYDFTYFHTFKECLKAINIIDLTGSYKTSQTLNSAKIGHIQGLVRSRNNEKIIPIILHYILPFSPDSSLSHSNLNVDIFTFCLRNTLHKTFTSAFSKSKTSVVRHHSECSKNISCNFCNFSVTHKIMI